MMTRGFVAAAMLALLIANPANACKGGKVLFSDDFRDVDPAWPIDAATTVYAAGSGKFTITPDANGAPNATWIALYGGSLFTDADICVTITFPPAGDGVNDESGGLAFWGTDINNVYRFGISPAGTASIIRWQNGKVLFPVTWRKAEAVKTAPGSVNTLRLTLNGMSATTYINDKLFFTIKGQPPEGGGEIGLSAGKGEKASLPFIFTDLKVTDLPK